MKAERTAAMLTNAVSFDVETHMIQPGLLAPPLVCGSLAEWRDGRVVGAFLSKDQARAAFDQLLAGGYTIVGANIAYDMLVMAYDAARRGIDLMPGIFGAYEAGRVYDLQIAEALHGVALGMLGKDPRTSSDPSQAQPLKDPETGKQGRYSLNICTDLVLGRRDAKINDRFRQSYALLEDTPVELWPAEARRYPIDDAVNTLEVALAQCGLIPRPAGHLWPTSGAMRCQACGVSFSFRETELPPCAPRAVANLNLHNLAAQAYAAFAMHLGAAWGFRVDPAAVDVLERRVTAARATELEGFLSTGLLQYKREPNHKLDAIETTVVRSLTGGSIPGAATAALLGMSEDTLQLYIGKLTRQGVLTTSKNTSAIKRRVAVAYGCTEPCGLCAGSGKVPSEKTGSLVGCKECGSTGLKLSTAPVPRTETEGVGTSRDALSESGDELLIDFAAFTEEAKILETYIPFLRKGIDENGNPRPINLRPNVLLDTGRASYGDVVQQLPRGGGVRECIVARPGTLLCSCDYGGLELATHAQSCIWIVGWSRLGDALNREIKVHDALGATMVGKEYTEFVALVKAGDKFAKNVRQASKPANFGFPGGMGAVKLVLQQRKQGPDTEAPNGRKYKGLRFCVLIGGATTCGENEDGTSNKVTEWKRKPITPTCRRCIECAEDLRTKWFKQWPENEPYFEFISDAVDNGQRVSRGADQFRLAAGQVMQHRSARLRGGTDFCSAANGFFQGLAADGAKRALTRVAREQYDSTYRLPDGSMSPLYGTRTILFAHDELVVEMPREYAHEAALRLSRVMVESMREYTPDVIVDAPPALMERWFKGAEPVYHRGVLVPWTPDHNPKTCTECRV